MLIRNRGWADDSTGVIFVSLWLSVGWSGGRFFQITKIIACGRFALPQN